MEYLTREDLAGAKEYLRQYDGELMEAKLTDYCKARWQTLFLGDTHGVAPWQALSLPSVQRFLRSYHFHLRK